MAGEDKFSTGLSNYEIGNMTLMGIAYRIYHTGLK